MNTRKSELLEALSIIAGAVMYCAPMILWLLDYYGIF